MVHHLAEPIRSFIDGGKLVLDGELNAGAYSVLVFLTQRLLWPLTRMAETIDLFERAIASTRRILNLIETPIRVQHGDQRGNTGRVAVVLRDREMVVKADIQRSGSQFFRKVRLFGAVSKVPLAKYTGGIAGGLHGLGEGPLPVGNPDMVHRLGRVCAGGSDHGRACRGDEECANADESNWHEQR